MAKVHKCRPRTKLVNVKLHHFRDCAEREEILIHPIGTEAQLADCLTKPVNLEILTRLRAQVLGWQKPIKQLLKAARATKKECHIPSRVRGQWSIASPTFQVPVEWSSQKGETLQRRSHNSSRSIKQKNKAQAIERLPSVSTGSQQFLWHLRDSLRTSGAQSILQTIGDIGHSSSFGLSVPITASLHWQKREDGDKNGIELNREELAKNGCFKSALHSAAEFCKTGTQERRRPSQKTLELTFMQCGSIFLNQEQWHWFGGNWTDGRRDTKAG